MKQEHRELSMFDWSLVAVVSELGSLLTTLLPDNEDDITPEQLETAIRLQDNIAQLVAICTAIKARDDDKTVN